MKRYEKWKEETRTVRGKQESKAKEGGGLTRVKRVGVEGWRMGRKETRFEVIYEEAGRGGDAMCKWMVLNKAGNYPGLRRFVLQRSRSLGSHVKSPFLPDYRFGQERKWRRLVQLRNECRRFQAS